MAVLGQSKKTRPNKKPIFTAVHKEKDCKYFAPSSYFAVISPTEIIFKI